MSPAKRIMQLRDEKHAAGHPFMINSDLLPSHMCVYEYADGSMRIAKLENGELIICEEPNDELKASVLENLELAKKLATPDCFNCAYRGSVPGSAHISCKNLSARVEGDEWGIKNGWFLWPFNFDPAWLKDCSGYIPNELVEKLKLKEVNDDKNRNDGVV